MMSRQSPGFLDNRDLRLILFGGKGGSGKTTSAVATGIHLACLRKDEKILVVSTDPAHSLSDSFGCSIGDDPTPVKGVDNLWALEIRAEELLADFTGKHEEVMKKLAYRGTYFDEEDIADFFSLSLPGLDEVMAIIEIANILKSGPYDLVILDTAPTGHTIRLLDLPQQMERWIGVFDMMQAKHRYLSWHFTGRYVKDDADGFLETMAKDVGRVRSLLRNRRVTEFVPVTIPEPMSIYETERLLDTLKAHKISIKSIIVNRVFEGEDCPFCLSRRRDAERYLKEIDEKFAAYNLIKMPLFPHEIRGIEDLREFAEILFGLRRLPQVKTPIGADIHADLRSGISEDQRPKIGEDQRLQFILFGGKGGVGKTSMAAATALHLARRNPNRRILVFSTDPAHSLSDSFDCLIGDKITPIRDGGNLHALEIDAIKLLEDFKEEYKEAIDDVFYSFLGRGVDIKFDRDVMTELIELSPPGLDEMMALKRIMDLREDYDLFILDTAPTGHLLRFLELPDLVRDWLKTLFRLILKYRGVMRLTKLAERLVELSKNVRLIRESLMDSQKAEFVAITIPEAMGILEMERLLSGIKGLDIPCPYILINMVVPPTGCGFCALKREEQQRYVEEVKDKRSNEYLVTEVQLFPHEIRGVDDLTKLARVMYGSDG